MSRSALHSSLAANGPRDKSGSRRGGSRRNTSSRESQLGLSFCSVSFTWSGDDARPLRDPRDLSRPADLALRVLGLTLLVRLLAPICKAAVREDQPRLSRLFARRRHCRFDRYVRKMRCLLQNLVRCPARVWNRDCCNLGELQILRPRADSAAGPHYVEVGTAQLTRRQRAERQERLAPRREQAEHVEQREPARVELLQRLLHLVRG
mmetsp:Transcript_39725/g.131487  ORF Transcript_39725/g.131487 Transcript_39725/m.131487 type:complete len:207 (-) Transcript_39725:25-645(-)